MAAMVDTPAPVPGVGAQDPRMPSLTGGITVTLSTTDSEPARGPTPPSAQSDALESPPPAPNPSQDKQLIPPIASPLPDSAPSPPTLVDRSGEEQDWDVGSIPPETAMKMLARAIESLARVTGDIPATPAAAAFAKFSEAGGILGSVGASTRQGGGEQSADGKENEPPSAGGETGERQPSAMQQALREFKPSHSRNTSRPHTPTPVPDEDLRKPSFQPVALTSPEAAAHEPTVPFPTTSEGGHHQPSSAPIDPGNTATVRRDAQTAAIARKFFSKSIPPISIDAYLTRLQRYCPMSTAVWLASAHYIGTLALPSDASPNQQRWPPAAAEPPLVPLTPRTAHRLLLAALRVAMKALEDLRYPQARFAGVGGVAESELRALEISLCYLMDFNLQVDKVKLLRGAVRLQRATRAAEQARAVSVSGPSASGKEFVLNRDALPVRVRSATVGAKTREYH